MGFSGLAIWLTKPHSISSLEFGALQPSLHGRYICREHRDFSTSYALEIDCELDNLLLPGTRAAWVASGVMEYR